jgi:hypothetical protein
MAKKSELQRAMDHVNAQIEQLMQVRAALEATREAVAKVKPRTRKAKSQAATE